MFSELGLEIIDAGMKGDFAKAKKFQDLLSQAVVAISKHGNYSKFFLLLLYKLNL